MGEDQRRKRVALVTGGDSGIGASCVAAFANDGVDVAATYLNDFENCEKTCAEAREKGVKAIAIRSDVRDENAVEACFDKVCAELGMPQILINSAGLNMHQTEVAEMDLETWDNLIRTDLTGSFLTCRRFVRDLRAKRSCGTIINITSIHAKVMRGGGADYDAAKGGQLNLTKTLALEVARDGITVNAIAPGMILTPMNEEAVESLAVRKAKTKNIPLMRAGEPREVAAVAVFLASDAARYITGSTVTIDGGLSLLLGQGA